MKITAAVLVVFVAFLSSFAQEKPRVFITDSQSWYVAGGFAVSDGTGGGAMAGGSIPQTVELIENFGKQCPGVIVTIDKNTAAYVVLFERNTVKRAAGGTIGLLSKVDKIAVFMRNGDVVYSGGTQFLRNAVNDACHAIAASN